MTAAVLGDPARKYLAAVSMRGPVSALAVGGHDAADAVAELAESSFPSTQRAVGTVAQVWPPLSPVVAGGHGNQSAAVPTWTECCVAGAAGAELAEVVVSPAPQGAVSAGRAGEPPPADTVASWCQCRPAGYWC